MNDHRSCPLPFLLNALKHHIAGVKELIEESKSGLLTANETSHRILMIGRSMIDLYYGDLSPLEVSGEIKLILEKSGCFEAASYAQYMSSAPKKFRNVVLRDGSTWTLLLGYEPQRYIHIHPARGSKHTLRVGALALKTAICLMSYYPEKCNENELVPIVNTIRNLYLDEAPIKNEIYTRGLRRVLKLFM